ncbi:MAG: hypothetical protein WCK76_08820 [Elusimicrobiota bacterium]
MPTYYRNLKYLPALLLAAAALGLPPRAAAAGIMDLDAANTLDPVAAPRTEGKAGPEVSVHSSSRPGILWHFDFFLKDPPNKFNWRIDVHVASKVPQEAGHRHGDSPPELFYYPDWPDRTKVATLRNVTVHSPVLDQDQTFTLYLTTASYAQQITAYGYYTTIDAGVTFHPTIANDVEIRTRGLEPLPGNDALYRPAGATAAHPYNHYGTTTTLAALKDLAAEWKQSAPGARAPEYGNISLPWGGAIDADNAWKAQDLNHAFGIAADVGKRNFSGGERAALIKLMCGLGFSVYNAKEGAKEHYHVVNLKELARLRAAKWPADFKAGADGTYADCCAAKPGTPEQQRCADYGEKDAAPGPAGHPVPKP